MSLEVLLDSIRQEFSSSEGKVIVRSLQKDPLVWQFINDEEISLPYFKSAPKGLNAYAPGKIALWLSTQGADGHADSLPNLEVPLSEDLAKQTSLALDSSLNSGLPPADLRTAGLLALALIEKRNRKGSWQGISDEILIRRADPDLQKNYQIWRTPFACLYSLCKDYDDLAMEFLDSKTEQVVSASIPIIIHSILANPIDSEGLLDHLFTFSHALPIDHQLETLRWLDSFKRHALCETLAKHLIQTKGNVDLFAKVFSELEAIKTRPNGTDPLNKKIRYTLPEDLNRLAAFNYYSGDAQKARDIFQKSSDLLGSIRSQTLFQSLASDFSQSSLSNWLGIVNSIPDSKQARLFYIQTLIQQRKYEEAKKYLSDLPDSLEKKYLLSQMRQGKGLNPQFKEIFNGSAVIPSGDSPYNIIGYYPHQAESASRKDILNALVKSNGFIPDAKLADQYLQQDGCDPEVIALLRDGYLISNDYNKAIELTSFLELADPDNSTHKHMLASLYCQAKRWQDAYTHLQKVVKTESSPSIEDLENFALAALKTERVDMAISICQNILKQSPHNSKALVFLGEAYMSQGDPVKAIQHMEQVVELIPDEAETWLMLAQLWEKHGQSDRAFEILNKGMLALPQDSKLLHALGKAHLERQAPADALLCLRKAFDHEPKNSEIQLNLARAEYQLGKYEQAWQLLEPFLDDYQKDPSTAKLLGKVLLAMDREQTAEPILLFAAENFPEDLETVLAATRLSLGIIESSHENPEKSKLELLQDILNHADEQHQYHDEIQLHIADIKRLQGHHQEALDMYIALSEMDQAQSNTPDWRFSYGLGQASTALGNYEMGLAALQEANNKQPGSLMILHALAETYQMADLQEKAHKAAKSALRLAPLDATNILWYADFKTRHHEPEEAIKALRDALQILPDRTDLRLWLSKSQIANNSIQESKETLESLILDSKTTTAQLHQAAYLSVQINELELAIQSLEKSTQRLSEPDPIMLMDLARCYALIGQNHDSLDTLNLPEDLLQQNPELAQFKSDLLCELGQYDLAYKTLKSIEVSIDDDLSNDHHINSLPIKTSPLLYTYDFTPKGYYLRLGQLQRASGEIKSAQSALTKALMLDPKDIQVRNACAAAYAIGIDFENALKVCREVANQASDVMLNGHDRLDLVCTEAEILCIQGELETAINLIADPSLTGASYPRLLAAKSRLALAQGEIETAQTHLDKACRSYEKDWKETQLSSINTAFRQAMILHSIAEAESDLEDYHKAIQFHSQVSQLFDNQALFNWRYASLLVKAAQAQQVANLVSMTAHAPGLGMLSEEYYLLCQEMIENCKPYLSEDRWICLNAQSIAAFTGKWPLNLNVDACLIDPEIAASVIINCQDEALVRDTLDSYSDDIHVLQAFGLHALRFEREDGAAYVEKALQMDVSNPINHALLALLNWNEPELALNSFESALEFWPEESEWHSLAGKLYTQVGNTSKAAFHVQRALEAQPENAAYWQQSSDVKLHNNNLEQAKADLEMSASFKSSDPQTWVKMAGINQRMGNLSEAIENIHTASALAPDDKAVVMQEVKYLIDQKQFSNAEVKAKEILDTDASDEQAQIYLARSQAKQGKFDSALKGLAAAVENQPDNQRLLLESIKIRKEREGAESVLPELIALAHANPDDPDILTTLTDLLIQTNRLEEAEETAQTILRIIPEQAEVHLMLGRLQRKNGKLDQAIAHLSDAIHFQPDLIEAYLELGKTYQERRDLEKAIKIFQEGAKANNSDPRPYYHAGIALKDCKDYAAAETMLKQAKKYAPEDTNIIRQLGVVTALNLINNLRETR